MVFSTIAAAQVDDVDNEAYKKYIKEALEEYKAGNWDEAQVLFEQAHEINPNARTLRGMGMASYEARRYVDAITTLEASLKETRRQLTEGQRKQIQKLLEQAYRFVVHYHIIVEPIHVSLSVDGETAQLSPDGILLLDSGKHELVATLDGYYNEKRMINVNPSKDNTIHITMIKVQKKSSHLEKNGNSTLVPKQKRSDESNDTNSSGRLWTWVAAGSTAILGGLAIYFWLDSSSRYKEAKEGCRPSCTKDVVDEISTTQTLGNVFIGLAGASAASAVILFFVEEPQNENTPAVSANISINGIRIMGNF